jgi:4-amino-4-deoxy-L-arabinose transferase-like glycosyltransferase
MFPWSMFLTAMVLWLVHQIRANEPTRYASLFLACWVGVYVVLFSCAQTKLPSYITPCFPGLALLLGALIAQLCEGTAGIPRIWTQLALGSLGFAGVVLTVGMVVATYFIPVQPWMASLGVLPLLGGLVGVILWRRERSSQAMATVAASSVLFISLFFGVGLPHVGSLQQQEDVCDNLFRSSKEGELGYFSTMEPTWVFYAGQTITPLSLPGSPPGETNRWKVTPVSADQFFARGPNQYVITTDGEWKWLKPFVPAGVDVVTEAPRFLRKGNWLVIGRKGADNSTASTARPGSR